MVWLNTLSFDIPIRCAACASTPIAVVRGHRGGSAWPAHGLDVEILVRLHWRGAAMRWIPARVPISQDGVSTSARQGQLAD